MIDVYFSPDLSISELKNDENVSIGDNGISVKWDGADYWMGIGDTFRTEDTIFHLWGHSLGLPFYLYDKYGYVFSQNFFEVVCWNNDDIVVGGVIYNYMCLKEMKWWLTMGKEPSEGTKFLVDKIEADMEKLKPDFVKRVKELGIAKYLPEDVWELVCTDEEIAEYKTEIEERKKAIEERRINNPFVINNDDIPF